MSHLALLLLGPFRATLDGALVSQFEADTARALLVYLAMHPGTSCRREALAGLLWPEKPDAVALQNLRGALNRLRGVIGDRESSPPFLRIDRKTIEFDAHSDYWLDVAEFNSQITAAEAHHHRHLEACTPCLEHLKEAAQLYWGDFLTGFSLDSAPFEEWVGLEREHLHGHALDALCRLSDALLARGDCEHAGHYARRQLELEPWREEAHRQLMRALSLAGQRGAALAQYEICKRMLAEELNAEPEPETAALHDQISRGEPAPGTRSVSSYSPRGNLPPQLTPFVGRQCELEQLGRLLRNPAYRLITLAGPGGAGKTRLALAAAEDAAADFGQSAWFVPLADLAPTVPGDPDDLLAIAIAQSLGLRFYAQDAPAGQLLEALRHRELLLILDSFEHLLPAAGFLLEILKAAPRVTLLVTSRTRLHFQAEYVLRVGGLLVPSPDDPVAGQSPSIQLFAERAERTAHGFELSAGNLRDVIRICAQVQGLPLAIEMAAAWTERLLPSEIAAAIATDVDFLSTSLADVSPQHRSLRAVFAGSWRLLTPGQQRALAQARIFHGTFGEEAALTVTAASPDDLAALVDRSLLMQPAPGRYEMHDAVRQFAVEQWESQAAGPQAAEQRVLEERHSAYYLGLVAQRETALAGREPARALAELEPEMENARHAWLHAVAHGSTEAIARVLPGLTRYYALTRRCQEGARLFGVAADGLRAIEAWDSRRAPPATQRLLGQLLVERAHCLNTCAQSDRAAAAAREAVGIARQAAAERLEAAAQFELGRALLDLENAEALPHLEQALALAREFQARPLEADSLDALGSAAQLCGDVLRARAFWDGALVVHRELGNRRGEGQTLNYLGRFYRIMGDYPRATDYFEQALYILHEDGGGPDESRALSGLSLIALATGDAKGAVARAEQALRIAQDVDNRRCQAEASTALGHALAELQQWLEAQGAYEKALLLRDELGQVDLALEPLAGLARAATGRGDDEQARTRVRIIAGYLDVHGTARSDAAPRIYFSCYQVLAAGRDPEAATWLRRARQWLEDRSRRIDDDALRRSFLENVPLHRAILRAASG